MTPRSGSGLLFGRGFARGFVYRLCDATHITVCEIPSLTTVFIQVKDNLELPVGTELTIRASGPRLVGTDGGSKRGDLTPRFD